MLTGAIIGGGVWATLALIGTMFLPEGAKLDLTQTGIRAAIVTGVGAFWGWVLS